MDENDVLKLMRENCRFKHISEGTSEHFHGVVKDLGDGNTDRGIEIIRENHKWLKQMR